MILAESRAELREALPALSGAAGGVALVPTMGFLHEGHLSLVELAREAGGAVAVSIFVNPLQFGPQEDLDRYPRDLPRDLELLGGRGVDLVFHPSLQEMYPRGEPRVTVDPGEMGKVLCGAFRPGHFRGVLTVVARLFGLFRPRAAVFGRKDFQQAALIRGMVRDLELGVEVLLGPTLREEDGLAMSSRNLYLTPRERREAGGIYQGLLRAREAFRTGERSSGALRGAFAESLEGYPSLRLQYAELVHPETLAPQDPALPGSVLAVAAHCGATRLIDNLAMDE